MSESVKLKAVDSFHTSQTGTIHARAEFETHRAHADDLIARGLAVEVAAKKSPEHEAKQAHEPENKMAHAPSNKKA